MNCLNGNQNGIVLCVAQLLIQLLDLLLQICHGADHGSHIHSCQNIALGNCE